MPKKTFEDLLNEEFNLDESVKLSEELLNEVYIPITPLLAFLSFKKRVFDYLKNNKLFVAARELKKGAMKTAAGIKGEAAQAVEKTRAELGLKSGKGGDATVYAFTREQMDFLADLREKYGKQIVEEIQDFRREVLAPYQLLKRIIKKNYRITPKEVLGMTRAEFESALESGRRKIEKRGDWFNDKFEEYKKAANEYSEKQKAKEKLLKRVEDGEKPSDDLLRPIIEKMSGGTKKDVIGKYDFSFADLEMLMDLYNKTKKMINTLGSKENRDFESNKRLLGYYKTIRDIEEGKIEFIKGDRIDHSSPNLDLRDTFKKYRARKLTLKDKESFNQEEVIEKFKEELKKDIASFREKKNENQNMMAKLRSSIEFTDSESKIWKLKDPFRSEYSGNIADFKQALRLEDFDRVPVQYLKKDDEIIRAEKRVEAEIKAFERKLQKIISEEDFAKLKSMRLVSNIITVKELKDPGKMFKSNTELEQEIPQEKELPGKSEAVKKFKDIIEREYNSVADLNQDKKEAEEIYDEFEKGDDIETLDSLRPLLDKIRARESLKPDEDKTLDISSTVEVDDVEKAARRILSKDYNSEEELKDDITTLNRLVEKFEKDEPNATEKLESISSLISKAKAKSFKKDEEE